VVQLHLADFACRGFTILGYFFEFGIRDVAKAHEVGAVGLAEILEFRGIVRRVEELLDEVLFDRRPHVAKRTVGNLDGHLLFGLGLSPTLLQIGGCRPVRDRAGFVVRGGQDIGQQRPAVDRPRRGDAEHVEEGRPYVDTSRTRRYDDPLFQEEGHRDDQRNLRGLLEHLTTVAFEAALGKSFAVVGGDHDHRVFGVALIDQMLDQHLHGAVDPADGVVVDVRVRAAEEGRLLIVDVLVYVHQVQVEEPPAAAVDPKELDRRSRHVLVGPAPA